MCVYGREAAAEAVDWVSSVVKCSGCDVRTGSVLVVPAWSDGETVDRPVIVWACLGERAAVLGLVLDFDWTVSVSVGVVDDVWLGGVDGVMNWSLRYCGGVCRITDVI